MRASELYAQAPSETQVFSIVLFVGILAFLLSAWIGYLVGRGGRRRRECWHHKIVKTANDPYRSVSWVRSQLIDGGRGKMFWCETKQGGCGKVWFA